MSEKRRLIFDLEADNLLRNVTKIHCVSYKWEDEPPDSVKTIIDYSRMIKFFQQSDVIFIGHNIITYDMPVVKKILGVEVPYINCIDTLALSWNLQEDRIIHGLDAYGKDFGIEKPKVDDWESLTVEDYSHRCQEDVKINSFLWENKQRPLLEELYEGDWIIINKLINYLGFKMDCVREQELSENGLYLDVPRIESGIARLEVLANDKVSKLKAAMSPKPIHKKKAKPKKFYNKDGEVTKIGQGWLEFLKEKGISEDFEGEVEFIGGYEDPSPTSPDQVKKWLFSLGWIPEHIKFVRDKKTKKVSQVPQVAGKLDKTQVCPSIKKLFPKEPALEELNSLGIINHRLGILRGFLENMIEGKIYPSVSAITSTMRMKHKVLVNLPAYNAPYAEEIRSSIIAPEGYLFVGSDLVSGEDRTKRALIYKYDPEYVIRQNTPGYDPHTTVAVLAKIMTLEEEEFFKKIDAIEDKSEVSPEDLKEYKRLKDVRLKGKICNFSATYNIGYAALARAMNTTEKESKRILEAYWELNWAVREYCNNCKVKEVDGRMWIYQEVSKHWLPLRNDKDRLSATNQSLLAYIFDLWMMYIRKEIMIAMQMHDENGSYVKDCPEYIEERKRILKDSLAKVNKALNLPVEMDCSVQFAKNYAEAH